MDPAAAHVEAFNHAVATGDWDTFATRFAEDAVMSFPSLPIGPYVGRAEIAQAYRDNPPTEPMTILSSADGWVRFQWSSGATGMMQLTWSRNAEVATLAVYFD